MKKLFYCVFACSALFLSSCGDDYECTVEGVVGTYVGTDACNDQNVHSEEISFAATANANEIEVSTDEGLVFVTTLNDCRTVTFTEEVIAGTESKEYDFTFKEGEVEVKTKVTTLGLFTDTCERTLNKQ